MGEGEGRRGRGVSCSVRSVHAELWPDADVRQNVPAVGRRGREGVSVEGREDVMTCVLEHVQVPTACWGVKQIERGMERGSRGDGALRSIITVLGVLTPSCGPWGSWSRFNIGRGGSARDDVLAAREAARGLLCVVDRTVRDRLKQGRHILIEHPAGSEAWIQPETAGIRQLIQDGHLYFVRADGCALGYVDKESGIWGSSRT